jgi:DNA-binding XRE family transcriptional regulator
MVNENPGFKLVELRRKAKVTQKVLAGALGVTDHTIRNWEKGREEPRLFIWQVKVLCRTLGCSLDDLPDSFKLSNQSTECADDTFGATEGGDFVNN